MDRAGRFPLPALAFSVGRRRAFAIPDNMGILAVVFIVSPQDPAAATLPVSLEMPPTDPLPRGFYMVWMKAEQ